MSSELSPFKFLQKTIFFEISPLPLLWRNFKSESDERRGQIFIKNCLARANQIIHLELCEIFLPFVYIKKQFTCVCVCEAERLFIEKAKIGGEAKKKIFEPRISTENFPEF